MSLANSRIVSRSIPIELSYDNGVTWDIIVCVSTKTFNITTPTVENDTDCGLLVGTGVLRVAISGTFVLETRPAAGETSFEEMVLVLKSGASPLFRFQNPTIGSVGVGLYLSGACKITGLNVTGPSSADLLKVDMTITSDGNVTVSKP